MSTDTVWDEHTHAKVEEKRLMKQFTDTIFDSGNTMKAVVEYLSLKKPSSINLVTLEKRKVKN